MIGIVTNPNALGLVRDRHLAARLRVIARDVGIVRETHTPADLRAAVQEFRRLGIGILATCGGDGTNLSVLSEAVRVFPPGALPRVLILRGGTVNTVASELGLSGHPEEILARCVALHRRDQLMPATQRNLLRVGEQHGFLFGAGMAGRFFEAYYGGPITGVAWASVLAARIIGSAFLNGTFAQWIFHPVEAEITADGHRLPIDRFTLIVAATIASAGLGFKPTYLGNAAPGRLHLIASGLSPAELAANAPRCLLGRRLKGRPHCDLLAEEVRIRFARPETYTFDGDLFRAREVVLRAGPRVTFLTP
ncbi:MAG TPA: diacylglycerol kinase family protein [Polyangia bacterium]|jgi:diacylglycerol kinase family enzyme